MCHVASRARTSQPQIGWRTLLDALVREPMCATPFDIGGVGNDIIYVHMSKSVYVRV